MNSVNVINLDPEFDPVDAQQGQIKVNSFNFPSGCEPHVKIGLIQPDGDTLITTRIKTTDDLMRLFLATDAVRRMGCEKIHVYIPYLPFARQDRVMTKGEPFSLKVLANLINSQKYAGVTVFDPHSGISEAVIDNMKVSNNHIFVNQCLHDKRGYYIISPDAGAYKKIYDVCKYIGYKDEIVISNKFRDVTSGVIRSITVSHDDLDGKDCYIVDDICDGGATFTILAEELKRRNAGKINLIVSHGIFSKGIDALVGIDHVYTTNSFKDHQPHHKLTQYHL